MSMFSFSYLVMEFRGWKETLENILTPAVILQLRKQRPQDVKGRAHIPAAVILRSPTTVSAPHHSLEAVRYCKETITGVEGPQMYSHSTQLCRKN